MADSVDVRLLAIKSILTKAKVAMVNKDNEYNTVAFRLKTSHSIIFKMKQKFDDAKKLCEEARTHFELSMLKDVATAGVKVAIGFVRAVASVVTGTGLGADDYKMAIIEMMELIYELFELLDGLEKMLTLSETLTTDVNVYGIADVNLEVIESAAKLGIRSVVWKSLRNMVNVYLSTPKVIKIKGYHIYKRALLDFIEWGNALTSAIMAHANLARNVLNKQIEKVMQKTEYDELNRIYNEAVREQTVTEHVLYQSNLEAFNYQQMALDILDEFCQSYFYYYFKWCSDDVKPTLQDSINLIALKMGTALTKEFHDIALSCPSNPVKIHVPLIDVNNKNECTYQTCPVKNLRENHEVFVDIGLDHEKFRMYERVRIQEIRVYLDGAVSSDGEVDVTITNTGEFCDRYRFFNYTFVTTPRTMSFRYRIQDGIIKEAGCLSGSHATFFAELPPFATWKFDIISDLNPGIDLTNVTRIDLFFIAHATKTVTCASNRVIDRFRNAQRFDYVQAGHADLSVSCQRP